MFKYYAFNVTEYGSYCGSRIIRVLFFRSPIYAMEQALTVIPEVKAIVDFKRVK